MERNAQRESALLDLYLAYRFCQESEEMGMYLTRRQLDLALAEAEASDYGAPVGIAASGDAETPAPERVTAPGPSSARGHAGGSSSGQGPSSAREPAGENAQADAPEGSQGARTEMFTFESFSPGFFWKHKLSDPTCSICHNDMNYQCGGCDEREEENNQSLRTRFVPSCPIAWGECGHVFHNHCLRRWFSTSEGQTCPIDRGQFVLRRAE